MRFREDYSRAKVPMLPVVVSEKRAVQIMAITTIIMVGYSMFPLILPWIKLYAVYDTMMTILGISMLAVNIWLLLKPSAERAWKVFKISSPYLMFAFIAVVADVLLRTR